MISRSIRRDLPGRKNENGRDTDQVNCLISGHHWEAEAIASASNTIPALTATICPESLPLGRIPTEKDDA